MTTPRYSAAHFQGANPYNILKKFRVTRPEAYPPGSPGHTDATARQGYYIPARDAQEAEYRMRQLMAMEDIGYNPAGEKLDIEDWSDA